MWLPFFSWWRVLTFGRRDACVRSPNPLVGFSCKSFFRILLDSSFVVDSVIKDSR